MAARLLIGIALLVLGLGGCRSSVKCPTPRPDAFNAFDTQAQGKAKKKASVNKKPRNNQYPARELNPTR